MTGLCQRGWLPFWFWDRISVVNTWVPQTRLLGSLGFNTDNEESCHLLSTDYVAETEGRALFAFYCAQAYLYQTYLYFAFICDLI